MKIDVAVPEPKICANCENFSIKDLNVILGETLAELHTYTSYKCMHADVCEDIMDRMRQLFNDQQFRGGF